MVGAASGNVTVQQVVSHSEKDQEPYDVDEAVEIVVTADAVSDEQKEAAFGAAAAAEDQQKERTPIVWVGRSKGTPATTPSVATEPPATSNKNTAAEKPMLRLKPNAGFLLNLVADAERGNKRKCAEEATQVSLNVLGQAVAAGVRPQLARVGPDASNAAVRKVVLSVAQQQKLATCSALLREVAASFGFALHIAPDVGDEDSGEGEDGEGTTASGGEVGDGSGSASLANGNSAAQKGRPGFQTLQSLGIRLNLASRTEKAKPENYGPASEDGADTAPRLPKPRAPGINMAANRLAGAALGAIGVPNPDKAYAPARPSQSPAPQKLPAKGEGRTAVFGHDGDEEAVSEVELEELEDLDEGDAEVNDNSADENSAGQSGHNEQHPTSKQGQPPPGKGQFRGGLRMDTHDLDEPEEDSEGSDDGQAAAGTLQWKSATPGLRTDSLKRHESQSGTLASRAGAADVSRQAKQAAAFQPAVDMGRLLSRASAAATAAQQRRDTGEGPSAEVAAGSSADQVDDSDMPPAIRGRNGAVTLQSGKRTAQGVLGSAARQAKRAREEDEVSDGNERWEVDDQDGDEKSERSEEPHKGRRTVKRGGRAGRGLFGAAMAGLNGRCTQ